MGSAYVFTLEIVPVGFHDGHASQPNQPSRMRLVRVTGDVLIFFDS